MTLFSRMFFLQHAVKTYYTGEFNDEEHLAE